MISVQSSTPAAFLLDNGFNSAQYSQPGDRLPIQRLGKQFFLPVAKIVWIGTKHRLVYAYTENKQHVLDFGMEELFSRLAPGIFFRIHRSVIVNLKHIEKITPLSDGRCQLTMKDFMRSAVLVSRYRTADFMKAVRSMH